MYWPKNFTDIPIEPLPELKVLESLYNSRRYDDALTHAQVILERHPGTIMPHVIRASILINRKQYKEAEEEVNHGLAKHQDRSTLWLLAGLAIRAQDNYEQALSCFQNAVRLANSVEEKSCYLFHLAYTHLPLKHFKEASDALKESCKVQPSFVNCWALGLVFLWQNKLLLTILLASLFYTIFYLPFHYALLPILFLITFFLATSLFDVKVRQPRRAITGILWVVCLIVLLFVRANYALN